MLFLVYYFISAGKNVKIKSTKITVYVFCSMLAVHSIFGEHLEELYNSFMVHENHKQFSKPSAILVMHILTACLPQPPQDSLL